MAWLFLKIALLSCLTIGIFGWLCPLLISYKSTELVLAGVVVFVFFVFFVINQGEKIIKREKK